MRCPHCQTTEFQIKDGYNKSGSQRYRCKRCNRTYTPVPRHVGYPECIRQRAIGLYRVGMDFRAIARELGVNHQTVANWVNHHFTRSLDEYKSQKNE